MAWLLDRLAECKAVTGEMNARLRWKEWPFFAAATLTSTRNLGRGSGRLIRSLVFRLVVPADIRQELLNQPERAIGEHLLEALEQSLSFCLGHADMLARRGTS